MTRFYMFFVISLGSLCAQLVPNPIGPSVYGGSHLNDFVVGGQYLGTANVTYTITLASTGSPDRFSWTATDGGAGTGIAITHGTCAALPAGTGWQALSHGVMVCWHAATGHFAADTWGVKVTANGTIAPETFIQAGVGAVVRSAQAKDRESLSLLDFGADPTGGVDSSAAIQAWINQAIASGRRAYAPSGAYKFAGPINLRAKVQNNYDSNANLPPSQTGLTMYGDGVGKTTFFEAYPGNGLDAFTADSTTGGIWAPAYFLHDFALLGPDADNNGAPTTTSGYGIRIEGGDFASVKLENLLVTNFAGIGGACIWDANGEQSRWINVQATRCDTGIRAGQAYHWEASKVYTALSRITDPSNHAQRALTPGTSGATIPASFNDAGGTTTDGSVTWTDEGVQGDINESHFAGIIATNNYSFGLDTSFGSGDMAAVLVQSNYHNGWRAWQLDGVHIAGVHMENNNIPYQPAAHAVSAVSVATGRVATYTTAAANPYATNDVIQINETPVSGTCGIATLGLATVIDSTHFSFIQSDPVGTCNTLSAVLVRSHLYNGFYLEDSTNLDIQAGFLASGDNIYSTNTWDVYWRTGPRNGMGDGQIPRVYVDPAPTASPQGIENWWEGFSRGKFQAGSDLANQHTCPDGPAEAATGTGCYIPVLEVGTLIVDSPAPTPSISTNQLRVYPSPSGALQTENCPGTTNPCASLQVNGGTNHGAAQVEFNTATFAFDLHIVNEAGAMGAPGGAGWGQVYNGSTASQIGLAAHGNGGAGLATIGASGNTLIWYSGTDFSAYSPGSTILIAGGPQTVAAYTDSHHLTLSAIPSGYAGRMVNVGWTYPIIGDSLGNSYFNGQGSICTNANGPSTGCTVLWDSLGRLYSAGVLITAPGTGFSGVKTRTVCTTFTGGVPTGCGVVTEIYLNGLLQ